MSIFIEPGLYVSILELNNGPAPLPLENGFSIKKGYRVLGLYTPSETGEAYLILPNDRKEMWFISNRHIRVEGVFPDRRDFYIECIESSETNNETNQRARSAA